MEEKDFSPVSSIIKMYARKTAFDPDGIGSGYPIIMGHTARYTQLVIYAVIVPVHIVVVAGSGGRYGDRSAVGGTRVVGFPGGDEGILGHSEVEGSTNKDQ